MQEALIQAALTWPDRQPADQKGWPVTVAWRKFLDVHRSEASRRDREQRVEAEPPPGPTETADDTLQLFFLCAHPSLTPASAVALTLRAVGGLTTRQIAQAYLVPEATMAQRISRAKRTVRDVRFEESGDLATVLRVRGQMLDHMLVTRNLLAHYRGSEIHNEVLHDESAAFAIDRKYPESDHAPVVATFEFDQ